MLKPLFLILVGVVAISARAGELPKTTKLVDLKKGTVFKLNSDFRVAELEDKYSDYRETYSDRQRENTYASNWVSIYREGFGSDIHSGNWEEYYQNMRGNCFIRESIRISALIERPEILQHYQDPADHRWITVSKKTYVRYGYSVPEGSTFIMTADARIEMNEVYLNLTPLSVDKSVPDSFTGFDGCRGDRISPEKEERRTDMTIEDLESDYGVKVSVTTDQ